MIYDMHMYFELKLYLPTYQKLLNSYRKDEHLKGWVIKIKIFLAMKATPYTIVNGFLYDLGLDYVLKRFVLNHKKENRMHEAQYGPVGGHF